MKNLFPIFIVLVLGLIVVFPACNDEETKTTEPLPKVTIQGTVTAQLNLNEASEENVPDGTRIIFRLDSRDLVQDPIVGYDYKVLQYEATVSNGQYTISIPSAVFAAVNVNIVPVDFQHDQIQLDDTKEKKTYLGGITAVATQADERYFVNLSYNAI